MIVGTCGFGSTGSSAVCDYLIEFDLFQVLDRMEFTWVSGVDGLIDLDFHINHPHNRTSDSIIAINRYKNRVKGALRGYKKSGKVNPEELYESSEKFINSIIQLKWNWYLPGSPNKLSAFASRISKKVIAKVEKKRWRQVDWWPLKEISFSVKPEIFDSAAKTHVKEVLSAFGAKFDKPIVLDQPFSGNNPQACFKFFDDPYAIVVDRDPRDLYIFANTQLYGINHFMPISPVEDFVKYYRALRDHQPYQDANDRVLCVKFEDMIYHYDETTKRIRDFLHLPENPNPKSVFDPSISMPNTQLWNRFPQFIKDIEYIEKALPEFLFDFSGCPEPDLSGNMFYGKSPKHKR